jgi:hypothetical protein
MALHLINWSGLARQMEGSHEETARDGIPMIVTLATTRIVNQRQFGESSHNACDPSFRFALPTKLQQLMVVLADEISDNQH